MKDVTMGYVCLPWANCPGNERDLARTVARLVDGRSIQPETVHYKQIEVQAGLFELVAQSFPGSL